MSAIQKNGAPIRFEEVTVRYDGNERDAVADVSFEVPAGEFVVLLGPSGCGKSTLLRTVNRLIEPQSGQIFVDGVDNRSADVTALRRSIGYVIQAVGLFTNMTIAQNIAVVPSLLGWDPARTAARIDELLKLVQLDPTVYRNRRPAELSGGEQQRVGVARAIAAQPRVLLMDEPFGAVDAIVRASLQDETRRIANVLQTTILFVTHDVDEALRLADRIVVMQKGSVVQYDTPLALLSSPKTPFVAKLLDADDIVRRLQLLRVADAMQMASSGPEGVHIDASATLRESLGVFLGGAQTALVIKDGGVAGTLTFADIQKAIRKSA
ncbi:MAG: hypothetical protein NVS9B12_08570 [Vulcanimicrobiaceae bacterium]